MNKWIVLPVVTLTALVADQLTKLWILKSFHIGAREVVIENLFNLVHVRNRGGAFGLFANLDPSYRAPVFVVLSITAIAVILSMARTAPAERFGLVVALGLVLGGALGNLVDRIRLGEVVDFLDVYYKTYHWPAFNIADAAIVVGVGLLLIDLIKYPDDDQAAEPAEAKGQPQAEPT